jgi:F0F1-type ATP synthase epsilon subunit
MNNPFTVYIFSADGTELYCSKQAKKVDLPTPQGRLTILSNHQPVLCPLEPGTILLDAGSENLKFTSSEKGFALIRSDAKDSNEITSLRILLLNVTKESL